MTSYVAFLRAINVGGNTVVKMDVVREVFAAAGCHNVRTFIASGNVLFDAPARTLGPAMVKARDRLRILVNAQPDIIVRTAATIEGMVARSPFPGRLLQSDAKLYVALMTAPPTKKPTLPMVVEKEAIEVIAIAGADAFIVSRPKADGTYGSAYFLEARLGVRATTRNWNTIVRIAALLA